MTVACIFPGQGSQSVGMLASLAECYPLVRSLFDEASTRLGYNVWELVQEGPAERLDQTEHTQVAMLVADVAVFRVLSASVPELTPVFAGHSLGEYAALVAAGVMSLADAAYVVQMRGRFMQEQVPLGMGAMAAIVGLTNEQIEKLCAACSSPDCLVSPANYNAIGQVVIAGHTDAVEEAILRAEASGARLAKRIPVSVPCHCALLKPASIRLQEVLATVPMSAPRQTVISSVDLSVYADVESTKQRLAEQLYRPVKWVETIQTLQQKGVNLLLECGPGKVLSGLVKRIDKTLEVMSISDPESLMNAIERMKA